MRRSLFSKITLRINWAIRWANRESLSNGFPFRISYVWNDGYRQNAYMNRSQVLDMIEWLDENPLVARLGYIRDLHTGRFMSPAKFN